MLKSAGSAIKALVPISPTASGEDFSDMTPTIDQQKEYFSKATTDYFGRLYSLDVGLRIQIRALEEARIISAEAAKREQATSGDGNSEAVAAPFATKSSLVTGGGLGNLDVGWLNSRNDHVGKQMESDVWRQASEFLAELESRNVGRHDSGQ